MGLQGKRLPVGSLGSGMQHILELGFHAGVGHGHNCNDFDAPRRHGMTHHVTRRKIILLGGRTSFFPVPIKGCRGVTIVKSGTIHSLALKNNSSRLGMGGRVSPLRKLGTLCKSSGVVCSIKCASKPDGFRPRLLPRRGTSSLVRTTIGMTGSTSVMLCFNKLGGGLCRSYRRMSHLSCGLPCERSRLLATLLGIGGGINMVVVDNGTMTVP